ncbi:hypothetical protein G5T42_11775 [Microbacterium sp. 4R-513]|uniref:hypothetical protein n=1 Tax=Microbacterium sp. 4R-513 TaxID=2567934 RepID=UPI0013E17299|nr:hypothetical protein [Microbacterium sp. 4R-513]QIG40076.1 hypothetical protein G5T42_11775 [Microbacterium sp. 4R-513]
MQDPMGDELRALRERAYGPDADIDGDPMALARLRQLEAEASVPTSVGEQFAARVEEAPEPTRIAPPTEVVYPREAGAGGTPNDEHDDPDDTVPDQEADAEERPHRQLLVRGIALALALLVGAAVAYGVMQLRPGSVATLAASSDAEWPDFLGERQEGAEIYEDFFGLTVAIVPQPWGRGDDVPCLFVVRSAGPSAITTVGCGAGGYSPTAALAVTDSFPDELIAEYPVGTALQFVQADGQVFVYADTP